MRMTDHLTNMFTQLKVDHNWDGYVFGGHNFSFFRTNDEAEYGQFKASAFLIGLEIQDSNPSEEHMAYLFNVYVTRPSLIIGDLSPPF